MNALTYLQACILGLVQGFAEFLPISSSGHLALVQQLMGLQSDSQSLLIFNVATHLGTLIAVTIVFAQPIRLYVGRLRAESKAGFGGVRIAWRLAFLTVAASVPAAVVGLVFKDRIEAAFGSGRGIAIALLLTGTLLFVSGKFPRPRKGWKRLSVGAAVAIGVAQALAIMPGISRSGATICTAMMLGLRRRWAGQFSFLIAFPAILGAAMLKAKDLLDITTEQSTAMPLGPIVVGSLVATVSGYFALCWLMVAVQRAKLQHFCYYCWLAGLAYLVLAPRIGQQIN